MSSTNSTPIINELVRGPLVDEKGVATPAHRRFLQELFAKTNAALTLLGQLKNADLVAADGVTFARIKGTALTANQVDLAKAGVVNKTLANVADDAGSDRRAATANQKTGGDRGFNALDTNNRLANSFRANGVNTSSTPTGATTMSNDGVSTAIVIAASISQFAPGTVSYNSGSVDPGSFGKVFAVFDDASYAGGAVSYQALPAIQNQTAAEGRNAMGSFTTTGGAAKTGGGNTGGTGGTRGGRGYPQ